MEAPGLLRTKWPKKIKERRRGESTRAEERSSARAVLTVHQPPLSISLSLSLVLSLAHPRTRAHAAHARLCNYQRRACAAKTSRTNSLRVLRLTDRYREREREARCPLPPVVSSETHVKITFPASGHPGNFSQTPGLTATVTRYTSTGVTEAPKNQLVLRVNGVIIPEDPSDLCARTAAASGVLALL